MGMLIISVRNVIEKIVYKRDVANQSNLGIRTFSKLVCSDESNAKPGEQLLASPRNSYVWVIVEYINPSDR
jgi:hypothetical protein